MAPKYPAPLHDTIVEPFAGAAGYSLRHHTRKVILVEKNPIIAEIWRFLIGTTPQEVLRIPYVESVDDLPAWVPQGARWLVGFAMNAATVTPCNILSAGRRKMASMGRRYEGWSDAHRESVARQVPLVKHWRIIEGEYTEAPDIKATWFIDPPYQGAGKYYPSQPSNFRDLGLWCQGRKGQVMVCENLGADWLPFVPFVNAKSAMRSGTPNREAIWTNDDVVCPSVSPSKENP